MRKSILRLLMMCVCVINMYACALFRPKHFYDVLNNFRLKQFLKYLFNMIKVGAYFFGGDKLYQECITFCFSSFDFEY